MRSFAQITEHIHREGIGNHLVARDNISVDQLDRGFERAPLSGIVRKLAIARVQVAERSGRDEGKKLFSVTARHSHDGISSGPSKAITAWGGPEPRIALLAFV